MIERAFQITCVVAVLLLACRPQAVGASEVISVEVEPEEVKLAEPWDPLPSFPGPVMWKLMLKLMLKLGWIYFG